MLILYFSIIVLTTMIEKYRIYFRRHIQNAVSSMQIFSVMDKQN